MCKMSKEQEILSKLDRLVNQLKKDDFKPESSNPSLASQYAKHKNDTQDASNTSERLRVNPFDRKINEAKILMNEFKDRLNKFQKEMARARASKDRSNWQDPYFRASIEVLNSLIAYSAQKIEEKEDDIRILGVQSDRYRASLRQGKDNASSDNDDNQERDSTSSESDDDPESKKGVVKCDCETPERFYNSEPGMVWRGPCYQCKKPGELFVICDSCEHSFCSDYCFELYHGLEPSPSVFDH